MQSQNHTPPQVEHLSWLSDRLCKHISKPVVVDDYTPPPPPPPTVVCGWKLGLQLERYTIIENRRLITAYPCFEADNDSEPANQNTKIDSNTALILFISPLYTHSPRPMTMVCACCLHNATRQSFWRGGY